MWQEPRLWVLLSQRRQPRFPSPGVNTLAKATAWEQEGVVSEHQGDPRDHGGDRLMKAASGACVWRRALGGVRKLQGGEGDQGSGMPSRRPGEHTH